MLFVFLSRCFNAIAISSVHNLRSEKLPGREALRTSLVLRSSDKLSIDRIHKKEAHGSVETGMPGIVPWRKGIHLQVNRKIVLFFKLKTFFENHRGATVLL